MRSGLCCSLLVYISRAGGGIGTESWCGRPVKRSPDGWGVCMYSCILGSENGGRISCQCLRSMPEPGSSSLDAHVLGRFFGSGQSCIGRLTNATEEPQVVNKPPGRRSNSVGLENELVARVETLCLVGVPVDHPWLNDAKSFQAGLGIALTARSKRGNCCGRRGSPSQGRLV